MRLQVLIVLTIALFFVNAVQSDSLLRTQHQQRQPSSSLLQSQQQHAVESYDSKTLKTNGNREDKRKMQTEVLGSVQNATESVIDGFRNAGNITQEILDIKEENPSEWSKVSF